MNNRIHQFHEEAMKSCDEHRSDTLNYHRIYREKFAELIVQECVKLCEHESNDDEHDEYDMGMWVKAESIKTAIKQHFGVEG